MSGNINCFGSRVELAPSPPIPTAFDTCISVEEHLLFLWDYVKKMHDELVEKGILENTQ